MKAFAVGLVSLAATVLGRSKQQTLENFVYPWPGRADWPSIKMSYNYLLSGTIEGSEIVKDGTYSYSKDKGYVEPKVEKAFSYYTQIKVDSKNGRAVQHLWKDSARSELLSINAIDFTNARLLKVDYRVQEDALAKVGKCTIFQFSDSMMTSKGILDWIWQPHDDSPSSYMGPQCLSKDHPNVYGFRGIDSEGIPWQTFFDAKTKLAIKGFSGEGTNEDESGTTKIELTVDKHKIVSQFAGNENEFYPFECLKDYEFQPVDQPMMPIVDFGLLYI